MIKQLECFKFYANIFTIDKINNNYIAIALKPQNIKVFSTHDCQTIQNIYCNLFGVETTAIAFHPTLQLIAIANGEKLYIINIKEEKIIQTLLTHDGVIEKLTFIDNAPYLISGTQNGRIIQYRYEGEIHISRLCSFPHTPTNYKKDINNNFVSAIAYNKQYIAASGFGNAITIIKFNSHSRKFSFEISKSRINAISFYNENQLLFANIDGVLFISQIRKNATIHQVNIEQKNISQLVVLPQSSYILIISQSQHIILFNAKEKKIVKRHFLHFTKEVRSVNVLNEDELLVTLIDNSAQKITIGSQNRLDKLLKEEKVVEALLLIETNPMLENTPQAEEANALYTKIYNEVALELFESGEKDILIKLYPFEELTLFQDVTQKLLLAYENYPKLQFFYNESKFSLAYALCEKFPALKLTSIFQNMEDKYKKSFTLAQKQLLAKNIDTAREILQPFATIHSKRTMIQLLLRQNREFLTFLRAVAQKDYKEVEDLVKIHPTFKEIPSYITLHQEISKNIETIYEFIVEGKIHTTLNMLKEIEKVPLYKDEIHKLYNLAEKTKKLLKHYENDEFIACYETIDKHQELEALKLTQLLEDHWHRKIDTAELFALQGEIKAVKETLGELLYIDTRKDKIGDLLRVSFHAKINKELFSRRYSSAENFIYSYIDIFGIDSEIKQIMKSYEKMSRKKLAITLIEQKHKNRTAWRYEDIT